MTRRRQKSTPPGTPTVRAGFRDPTQVKSVVLRMGIDFVARLDELCEANQRSRREIIEILISEASIQYRQDPSARITPL